MPVAARHAHTLRNPHIRRMCSCSCNLEVNLKGGCCMLGGHAFLQHVNHFPACVRLFSFQSYNNDSSISYRMTMAVPFENGWATSFVLFTTVAQRARVNWTGCRLGGSHPDSVPLTRGAAQEGYWTGSRLGGLGSDSVQWMRSGAGNTTLEQ